MTYYKLTQPIAVITQTPLLTNQSLDIPFTKINILPGESL